MCCSARAKNGMFVADSAFFDTPSWVAKGLSDMAQGRNVLPVAPFYLRQRN
jgi:hypothetical protein